MTYCSAGAYGAPPIHTYQPGYGPAAYPVNGGYGGHSNGYYVGKHTQHTGLLTDRGEGQGRVWSGGAGSWTGLGIGEVRG